MEKPKTNRQKRALETKAKIVAAARKIISEKGFDNVSVGDITKEAKVSTGSFYTYFKCKEDIIGELNKNYFYRLAEIANEMSEADILDRLIFYCRNFLLTIEETGIELCRQWTKDNLSPVKVDILGEETTKYIFDYEALLKILNEAVKRGELVKETPVDELALFINAELYGLMVAWCMSDAEVVGSDKTDRFCKTVLNEVLKTYRSQGENMEYVKMNNGIDFPVIGIGTFMISPEDAEVSVREAFKNGYELVDTANMYNNERAVGRGVKESGVPRENVFISTKLWPSEFENENAVDETLERLGVDYVDLLFIHQPAGNWLAGYRQLEKAYKEGKAKAIGISNFEGKYLDELSKEWEIVPQFIQVEAHPYFTQDELRKILDKYDIKLMSWYPLGHGDQALLEEPVFVELAQKYGKTPAQIILRWHTQMGFVVIPGSKNVDHIRDNIDIFDFELTDDEMDRIAGLNKNKRYYNRTDEQLVEFAKMKPIYEKA